MPVRKTLSPSASQPIEEVSLVDGHGKCHLSGKWWHLKVNGKSESIIGIRELRTVSHLAHPVRTMALIKFGFTWVYCPSFQFKFLGRALESSKVLKKSINSSFKDAKATKVVYHTGFSCLFSFTFLFKTSRFDLFKYFIDWLFQVV